MKKVVVIILFFALAVPAVQMHQLLKLGHFLMHYENHKRQDKTLTLLGFIRLHYTNQILVHSDMEQDMKLPFKNYEQSYLSQIFLPQTPQKLEIQYAIPHTPNVCFNTENSRHFLSACLSPIWQPPKPSA